MKHKPVDVLVVGGGVVGLSIAWYCLVNGLSVRLLDRDSPSRNTSWAGFGVLPGRILERAERPYGKLLAQSGVLHKSLAAVLLEETGIDNEYRPCGEIRVCTTPDFSEQFHRKIERYTKGGVICTPKSSRELKELEPYLASEIMDGYHLPQTAQIRNPRHLKALRKGILNRGGHLVFGEEVTGFQIEKGRLTSVTTEMGAWSAGNVVVSCGAWTGRLLENSGLMLKVKPVKGQALILEPGPIFSHIIASDGLLMVPRKDGKLVIGSTMEHNGFHMQANREGVDNLLQRAVAICPYLAKFQPTYTWAGLRPCTPDRVPYIGPVPHISGLWVATGHYKLGILLSAATGLVMSQLLAGEQTDIPSKPFRLDRRTRRGGKRLEKDNPSNIHE